MKIKTDQSYGVIPYAKRVTGIREYFLIHQFSQWRGDSYWGFPKGHLDVGETPEQAALRELQEETQLILESLNNTVTFDVSYEFVHEEVLIKKTVSYFVGAAASHAYTLDSTEVHEGGWFTLKEALDRLTHEKSRAVLRSADEYLEMVDKK